MIRLLLSLLALMTGLAVQGAPAQALACGAHDTQINAPAPARAAAHAAVHVATFAVGCGVAPARGTGSVQWFPAVQAPARPGVLIGIDRAHE